jgi:cyclopropane fatty-acyl-phospholipid synthase-like methyltransferase
MLSSVVERTPTGGWSDAEQVEWYTSRIGALEPRRAGERALAELLPPAPRRALDLGCGDGRLGQVVLDECASVEHLVAVDRSPPMLAGAHARFESDRRVEVRTWDLTDPITPLGGFDLIVSGFAIHHLPDERKRALFTEVSACLNPGGFFANLEVVSSATPEQHAEFLTAIGRTADDPEDRLASVEDQLQWMERAGLTGVCSPWRWRSFALLVGNGLAPPPAVRR